MLDLRLPLGVFFLLIGAILTADGLLHPITSPGVNLVLNRDWGVFLLVFGALMAGFGWKAQKQGVPSGGAADDTPSDTRR